MRQTFRTLSILALTALVGLLAGACMTERDPIDKSNPLALDKKLFEGEFFYKQTMVDMPYSVDYTFVGETSSTSIVKFEITENALYIYSIHNKIEYTNTEGEQIIPKTPLVVYPILDHFDIELAENPTTGEDMPIYTEYRDKPWWERRYFLLDPGSDMVTNYQMDFMQYTLDVQNPFSMTGLSEYYNLEFYNRDEEPINPRRYYYDYVASQEATERLAELDPEASTYEAEKEALEAARNKEVNVISWENDVIVKPTNNWRAIGDWNNYKEYIDYEYARLRYRHYFWRVDRDDMENSGFEPMEFQDLMFRRFGYFVREYRGVDPQVGYHENLTHWWANHYNVNRRKDNGHEQNRVHVYLSPNFPERMTLAACGIAADYNWAFARAVHIKEKAEKLDYRNVDNDTLYDIVPWNEEYLVEPIADAIETVSDLDLHSMTVADAIPGFESYLEHLLEQTYPDEDVDELGQTTVRQLTEDSGVKLNKVVVQLERGSGVDYPRDLTVEELAMYMTEYLEVARDNAAGYDLLKGVKDEWKPQTRLCSDLSPDSCFQTDEDGEIKTDDLGQPMTVEPGSDWPGSLDDQEYYWVNYLEDDADKMAEWKRWCFRWDDYDEDQQKEDTQSYFILHRNAFLEYSYVRDGMDPDGVPNLITPDEIRAKFGDDINDRVAREVNYPVACKLTLEHRCEVDSTGHKVPRYKYELGDGQHTFLYWVDLPTEFGILGVSQWSDNPETGELLSSSSHIAGSVLQWSVSREMERYFMIEGITEEPNPLAVGADRYKQLLEDIVVSPPYFQVPEAGEEDVKAEDLYVPPPPLGQEPGNTSSIAYERVYSKKDLYTPPSSKVKLNGFNVSTEHYKEALKENGLSIADPTINPSSLRINYQKILTKEEMESQAKLTNDMMEKAQLPMLDPNKDLSRLIGTPLESYAVPPSVLRMVYSDSTAYSEDMLEESSPMFLGSMSNMKAEIQKRIDLSEKCYFMGEWLDGGFLAIIKQLQKKGYNREEIRATIEKIMFKGVAEHELGHSIGLRHNFMASADELNYVGNDGTFGENAPKDGYWAFRDMDYKAYQEAIDLREQEMTTECDHAIQRGEYYNSSCRFKDPGECQQAMESNDEEGIAEYCQRGGLVPLEKFYLKKTLDQKNEWFMYSSVMDYMDEFYYHGYGLGRYDVAAIEYAYGRSVEVWDKNNGKIEVRHVPLFEPGEGRLCTENDLTNDVCRCTPTTENADSCLCVESVDGYVNCYNPTVKVKGLRYVPEVSRVYRKVDEDGKPSNNAYGDPDYADEDVFDTWKTYDTWGYKPTGGKVAVHLNGNTRPYLFGTDHWRFEEPYCNVWDKGFTARDIIRNFTDQYNRFYFWRYFRRGRPTFSTQDYYYWWQYWISSFLRFHMFAHFALDLQYNIGQKFDWFMSMYPNSNDAPVAGGEISKGRADVVAALNGIEDNLTPLGPGDYLVAAAEGFNFLVYDVFYRPDIGLHYLDSWSDDPSHEYIKSNDMVIEDSNFHDYFGNTYITTEIGPNFGRYHRDHWDYQDDSTINYAKLIRRGFTIEKDMALNTMVLTGWWMDKYGYESMANGFHYLSDGFDSAVYHIMADIINEDRITTFSPYCARKVTDESGKVVELEVKRYIPPTNTLLTWNVNPWFEPYSDAWAIEPTTPEPLCDKLSRDTNEKWYPVHASWIYFDKRWPGLMALFWLPNTMADNTVYMYFQSRRIPLHEHSLYPEPEVIMGTDPHTGEPTIVGGTVECLNHKETMYYRAQKFVDDTRPNPVFDLVARCKQIHDQCMIDPAKGQVPGNYNRDADTSRCSASDMEHIESTLMMLNEYTYYLTNATAD